MENKKITWKLLSLRTVQNIEQEIYTCKGVDEDNASSLFRSLERISPRSLDTHIVHKL